MNEKDLFRLSHEQLTVISPHKLRDWWLRIRVPLPTRDLAIARDAVRLVYQHHDALRLQLVDTEGGVRQRVRRWVEEPEFGARLPILHPREADLLDAPDPYQQVSQCALLAGDEGVEVDLRVHHLGWDGWSGSVFARDLRAYVAAGGGSGPPPPVASFRDHVRAQYRAGRSMGPEQRTYWRRVLRNGGASSGWSAKSQDRRAAAVALPRPEALAAAARAARATPAALVAAAVLRSLAEVTGVPDRLVYLVHHGRDEPRFFPVVGFFARSVPLRVDTAADRDLPALARSTMLRAAEAVEHSRPPFALYRLARELELPGTGQGAVGQAGALAEVTINLQAQPPAAAGAPGRGAGLMDAGPAGAERPPARPGRLWFLGMLDGAGRLWAEHDALRYPDDQVATVLSRTAELLADSAGGG